MEPFSPCHRATNRSLLASNAITKNPPLVRLIRSYRPSDTDTLEAYENIEIITRSHPDAFPSALRQKRKTQTRIHEGKVLPKVRHHMPIHPGLVIESTQVTEKCPACGHPEAFYEEKQVRPQIMCPSTKGSCITQMRSADEGSTILYTVCLRYPGYRFPSHITVSVRLLQTWVADQQLKKRCCAETSAGAMPALCSTRLPLQYRKGQPRQNRRGCSRVTRRQLPGLGCCLLGGCEKNR